MDQNNSHNVLVKILSKDRIGLIYEITSTISSLNVPIMSHGARVYTDNKKKKMSLCSVCICIDDENIQTLFNRLRKIKGVVRVTSENNDRFKINDLRNAYERT